MLVSLLQVQKERELSLSDTSRQSIVPFLKWAGGKSSLMKTLLPHVPLYISNYYEPFLGGGALFFALCGRHTRFKSFLSDTNAELVNAYGVIKDRPTELIERLSKLREEYNSSESKETFYYRMRGLKTRGRVESAARIIFLNKTCFNGLYRVNSSGEFNVPFGRYKNPRIFDSDNLISISKALRETNVTLQVLDYKSATRSCVEDDFVYLDPPYNPTSETSAFTSYTSQGFSEDDQRDLATVFSQLCTRDCHVLLSNSDTPLVRQLYAEYSINSLTVNRPINSVGTKRRGFGELLIFSSPASGSRRLANRPS
jgi:DNA adenine methylase